MPLSKATQTWIKRATRRGRAADGSAGLSAVGPGLQLSGAS